MAVNPIARIGGFFGRFFGTTIADAAAFGIGGAMEKPIEPLLQQLANETWATATAAGVGRPLSIGDAADIVAEDVERRDWGIEQAGEDGHTSDQFAAVLGAALQAPGLAGLYELWRRRRITDTEFVHGLRKARLEPEWDAPLMALHDVLLSPETLANARQQGFMPPDATTAESGLQGVTADRADVLFELSGNPPGPETLLDWLRRGVIDETQFVQGIREGRIKTKYTDEYLAVRQPLLTVHDYVTQHLKGWITQAEMNAGGALHGYSPAQMNQLFENAGRPAAPGQMWTAAARKIDGPDGTPMDRAQFIKAIKESDIRPEYGPMLWEIRYLYPPLFQLTRLVTAGQIDADTAAEWATKDRYAPEVVAALHEVWSKATTASASPYVGKAETHLWTTTHTAYKSGEADESRARENMTALKIDDPTQTEILGFWNLERATVRQQLSLRQLQIAYADARVSPDEARAELVDRGYSLADVETLIYEWDQDQPHV
jgi:hypothetical protein